MLGERSGMGIIIYGEGVGSLGYVFGCYIVVSLEVKIMDGY